MRYIPSLKPVKPIWAKDSIALLRGMHLVLIFRIIIDSMAAEHAGTLRRAPREMTILFVRRKFGLPIR